MEPSVREQILAIRAGGETNMLDVGKVEEIALRDGFDELADYLKDHKSAYCHFILTGWEGWGIAAKAVSMKEKAIARFMYNPVNTDIPVHSLVSFARSIDFTELFDHIRFIISAGCTFSHSEITMRFGGIRISFMSKDIAGKTGVFTAILERCAIRSSNNRVYADRATGRLTYLVDVDVQFGHKDGGSGGMNLLRAWYRNDAWEFLDAGQRRA